MANISYGVNILPKTNNAYTLGNSDYKWANIFTNKINGTNIEDIISGSGSGESSASTIEDVQINGTSIVSNGVATIPMAATYVNANTQGNPGLVRPSSWYGTKIQDGVLAIAGATEADVKTGTTTLRPLTPLLSKNIVFYGLAKAAGDSTQSSSSNAIGTYTTDAKSAIQSMLAVAPTASPIFTGSISLGRAVNTTIGSNSFAAGDSCEASAEEAHAEGRYTTASGYYSHAEGNYTTASGMAAHAEGTVTVANHASQHVFGEYNVEDSSEAANYSRGNFVEIVGNGTASNAQSNARALDWSGNEYLNGYLYVGCNASSGSGTRIPHDIQINSTSIVSNGVANIPIAGYQSLGVVSQGSGITIDSTTGELSTKPATITQIKEATSNYAPIAPNRQQYAVFYGLAAAAGDSTQSASSNSVGIYTADAKSAIQSMLGISTMIGATSSVAGSGGLVPAPATTDVDKFLAGDGTYKSGGLPMVILSYGNSVWQDFIDAYNNNVIVYCRASSNSNPASGSQTRMAFMAYVNNATTPTEVEFQYYRSMSSHSATAMGDQVFVYKLTKTGGWSVTTRDASIKEINVASGSKLGVSWSSNKVTLSNTMTANDMPMSSSDATTVKSSIDTLNSNLNNLRTSNDTIVSNIAGVKTALINFASAMNVGEAKLVRIVHTDSSDYSIMRPSVRYSGYLTKNENNDFSWLASGYLEKEPVIFSYYGGTQYWVAEKIALNSNLTNQAKIYRINIKGEEVAASSYFNFVSDYLADGFVTISNNNEIHFNATSSVMVFVNLIGKTSEQGTRAWIQLEGGNTVEQSIGYGTYQKHTLIGQYIVGTSTVLKLKNVDAYPFTPGGGGTIGSRIIIKRNG